MKLYKYFLNSKFINGNIHFEIQMSEYDVRETSQFYYFNNSYPYVRIPKNEIGKVKAGKVYLLDPDLNKAKKCLSNIIQYNISRYEDEIESAKYRIETANNAISNLKELQFTEPIQEELDNSDMEK